MLFNSAHRNAMSRVKRQLWFLLFFFRVCIQIMSNIGPHIAYYRGTATNLTSVCAFSTCPQNCPTRFAISTKLWLALTPLHMDVCSTFCRNDILVSIWINCCGSCPCLCVSTTTTTRNCKILINWSWKLLLCKRAYCGVYDS